MLEVLRKIGARLLKEMPSERGRASRLGEPPEGAGPPLPRGAGGDMTHPIDRRAEEIILDGLTASGLPLTVISEEAGLVEIKGGGKTVIIDPVDGSRNAVAGIPFYCTSIAVADGHRLGDVELAYVVNLASGDEFRASKGGGAFLNGGAVVTQKDDVLKLVAFEAHVPGKEIPRIMPLLSEARKARCFGATALALSHLAAGGVSVFTTPSLSRSFDFAAGWLLVREAGGVFTDIEGKSIDEIELGLKHISTILASANPGLHARALKLLGGGA